MAEIPSESKSIPEEIKKSVRAVLLSKIGGVPLDRFSSDFKKLAGYPLPFKELGFSSVRKVLEAMPDAVRFNYSDEASKWMLYGIGDPNSYMSSAAKKAQYSKPGDGTKDANRKRNRKKSGKSKNKGDESHTKKQTSEDDDITGERLPGNKGDSTSPKLNTDRNDEEIRVPKSRRGFHSVCVYYRGKHDSRNKVMQEITELFATQGDVIEKSYSNNLMFFRFLTEEEAVSVIKQYNGRCLSDGKAIRVSPASEKMPAKNSNEKFEHKPSKNKQREQQQQHLEHLQHQQMLAHHMIQQYHEPEAYQFMGSFGHIGMHEDRFFGEHHEYYGCEGDVVEICVFNINKSVTKEDLMSAFWQFNPLYVRLRSKPGDGSNRTHFAFVAFACLADAHNAEASMQNALLRSCRIKMEIAKTRPVAQRSPEERALLQQAKKLNNQKPKRERRDKAKGQPQGSRSEDESNDSISAEIVMADDPDKPSYIDDKVPVIDDSPYSTKSNSDESLSSGDSERSPVPGLQEGGVSCGRGRASLLSGHVSPSVGRGLAMFNTEVEKKRLRPSLADLADKLHEL